MAYTTIDDPTIYFNTVLYEGNGSTNAITGVGFQPDWVWIKDRDDTSFHTLFDVIRGATKRIFSTGGASNVSSGAEDTQAASLTSFDSDGFTLGSHSGTNSSTSHVSWNWKAGGSASSNSDGDISTNVSLNSTAGFSIVSYSGNGSSGQTVGHGLGVTPDVIITKNRDISEVWRTWHTELSGQNYKLQLDLTQGEDGTGTTVFNGQSSSTFTVGTDPSVNGNGNNIIAYCFKGIQGYSKFGTYTGNGDANGAFVYTGFRPAFVLFKRKNGSGNWQLLDDKRTGLNPENHTSYPNSNLADQDETDANLLSNGFNLTNTGTDGNGSGDTYVYLSFAHSPFVNSKGVPTNAR